jgi:hypothetical protein
MLPSRVAGGISSTNTLVIARAGSDTIQDVVGGASLTSVALKSPREASVLESDGSSNRTILTWNKAEPFTSFQVSPWRTGRRADAGY